MDIDALLNPKKTADAILQPAPARSYAAGIAQPATVRQEMRQGFLHGKKKGSPTHWPEFENHFSWKPGELSVWTGQNNSGKSETVLQLMLLKSLHDGWKWAIFSPENEPVAEIYDQLAHALVGKSPDPTWANQMQAGHYEKAMDFLFAHFFVVSPPEIWTLDVILDYFGYLHGQHHVQGCLLDPWNQLVHDLGAGGREDLYLSTELSKAKRFAMKHQLCFNITAHPSKPNTQAGEKWRCPDQFSLSGGAMWGNKADNVLAVHRPSYREDKACTLVEWHSHKIKKQKLVGRPGFVSLDFDYGRNRYLTAGASPLEAPANKLLAPEMAGLPIPRATPPVRPLNAISDFDNLPPF